MDNHEMALLVRRFHVGMEFENLSFCGGRKTEGPGEKPSANSTHI